MRRFPLYSRSSSSVPSVAGVGESVAPAHAPKRPGSWSRWQRRINWPMAILAFSLAATLGWVAELSQRPVPASITQDDIDRAVVHTFNTHTLPSATARAANEVAPSVVRIVGFEERPRQTSRPGTRARPRPSPLSAPENSEPPAIADGTVPGLRLRGIGTGVVIVEDGTILTNLHVVRGSPKLKVIFADGTESDATMIGAQPENDLAVLRARTLPDDLKPATLGSTAGLRPGDPVVAIGHPFGVGPSVSAGVISGFGREFETEQGNVTLKNLIQFDAAANPGNSGGPLIAADGSVVGIVTAIMNPSGSGTFAGIGFAVPIESATSAIGMSPF